MNWIEEFLKIADRLSVECVFYMKASAFCSVETKLDERIIRFGHEANQVKYTGQEDIRTFMINHTADAIASALERKYQMSHSDAFDLYNRINYWLHACFRQCRVVEDKLFYIRNGMLIL